jgi:hypothetical protein
MGSTINLSTPSVSGATYHWSGPQFLSTAQNPSIPGAVPGMAGNYYVHTSTGSCTSDSQAVNIVVANPVAETCSISNNTATIKDLASGKTSNLNLNTNCLYVTPTYQTTASDSAGTYGLVVNFATMPTKSGIYNIISTTVPGPYSVYITAQGIAQNRAYNATGGYAYVQFSGTSFSVSFCSIHFTSPIYTNSNLTVSANMVCQ